MTRLVVETLSKRYGAVIALESVSLAVGDTSRTAIVGPSGSGKSTLLRLIAGFEAPDRGRIVLGGATLADNAASVPAHRRGIGIVAQDGALFPHLNVADNIGFGLDRGGSDRDRRIRELIRAVELDPALLKRQPHELSGGQQQRVALARALARKPRLMLLDEPFSALDTSLRETTRRSVARILDAYGIPCILVTHDQAEAMSFADQVAILREGRLAQVGSPRELYLRPRDAEVAAFLGDAIIMPAHIRGAEATCRLGQIPVASGSAPGPAEIMVRPEQIHLAQASTAHGAPGPNAHPGRVIDLAFGGAMSTITLALDAGHGADAPADAFVLTLTAFSIDLPAIGDRVQIVVKGAAHVLDRKGTRPAALALAPAPR